MAGANDITPVGGVTRALAAWAASSQASAVPDDVLAQARLLVLDGVGCGLFGSTQESAAVVTSFVLSVGGPRQATVWGTPHRVPAALAPLANGTAMHAFEYDDLHPRAVLHAGAQVLPVAFAVAEMRERRRTGTLPPGTDDPAAEAVPADPVTGTELLHAIVVGFEVGARVGLATGAGQLARGFHPSPNSATFAAAATAARLLGLDEAQTADALGIAGSFGGYLMAAQYGAMVKRVHAGHSGQSGLTAALLAARGLTGTQGVLEAPYGGFAAAYTGSADVAEIGDGLGTRWEIPNFTIKYYPCCGSNHTSLDAWLHLRREAGLSADDVENIEVKCSTLTADHVGWSYTPDSITTAQMNLAYCLAAAVVDGRVTADQFAPARLRDPEILEVVRRIRVHPDPAIDALGRARRHTVDLTVTLKDGRSLHQTREFAKGSAGDPLRVGDIVEKFRDQARRVLPAPQVSRLERQILTLGDPEGGPDILTLTKLLARDSDQRSSAA